jgi:hypothetical protein
MLLALRLAPPISSVDAALWELLYKSQFLSPTVTTSPTDNLPLVPRAITHMSREAPPGHCSDNCRGWRPERQAGKPGRRRHAFGGCDPGQSREH